MASICLRSCAGDRIVLDVVLAHQAAQVVVRNDHADRAGRRRRLGVDRVLLIAHRHRHVIAAAGRDAPHADHHRHALLFAELREVVIDVVPAGDRAAGRIDAHHDRLDVLVLADAVDLLLDEAVPLHDHPFDREEGDFVVAELLALDELLWMPPSRVKVVAQREPLADQHDHAANRQGRSSRANSRPARASLAGR